MKRANESPDSNNEIFKGRCSNKPQIKWLDENHLKIAYSEETEFWSQSEWEKVIISYSLIANNQ